MPSLACRGCPGFVPALALYSTELVRKNELRIRSNETDMDETRGPMPASCPGGAPIRWRVFPGALRPVAGPNGLAAVAAVRRPLLFPQFAPCSFTPLVCGKEMLDFPFWGDQNGRHVFLECTKAARWHLDWGYTYSLVTARTKREMSFANRSPRPGNCDIYLWRPVSGMAPDMGAPGRCCRNACRRAPGE